MIYFWKKISNVFQHCQKLKPRLLIGRTHVLLVIRYLDAPSKRTYHKQRAFKIVEPNYNTK